MWLLDRMKERTPDIIVHVRHQSNTKGPVLHLTATHDSLLKNAEELAIRKDLKDEYGGGMKEFTYEDQDCFSGVLDEETFFSSQERQSIVHYMLSNLRALKGETLGKITFLEGQAIIPLLESKHIISQVFPLHSTDELVDLRERWMQRFFSKQPLDDICDYFGVKIAMYFAYLGHYTAALCFPAFLGFLIWYIQGENEGADDFDLIIFALFNALWATLYLEHWKRRSSELAYEWGTLDKKDELLEDPRPLFTGDLVESPITGRLEPYYPQWKRNLFRYFVSLPVVLLCLFVVFVVMMLIFQFQEWINVKVNEDGFPGFLTFLPKILLAICIGIFDEIYKKIAHWLNDMENYRMDGAYENHLIVKLAIFQFVNSFLSLFYIAFYLQDMDRLSDQLAAILITRQILGNIKEALLPYLQWQARLCKVGYEIVSELSPSTPPKEYNSIVEECSKESPDGGSELRKRSVSFHESSTLKGDKIEVKRTTHRRESIFVKRNLSLTQAEVESEMKKYEDTLEDHLEMLIQFGYVTLFSSAFPLAALCALLNNVIEIRSDAFKLCMNHQRPFGKRVESIGTWQDALELMGVIAVGVNCALIGVSGQIKRLLPVSEFSTIIIIIVILEHVILAVKLLIAYAIPDVPESIATKKAKLEFLRRVAFKKLESHVTSSNSGKETRVPRQISKNNLIQPDTQILHTEQRKLDNFVSLANSKNRSQDQINTNICKKDIITEKDSDSLKSPRSGSSFQGHGQSLSNSYGNNDRTEREKNSVNESFTRKTIGNLNTGKQIISSSQENEQHKDENLTKKVLSKSHSIDRNYMEKYINPQTGTIDRTKSLPDDEIKKLLESSERRRSGTYVSSLTIPLQTTTQRKTMFSVVKTGHSSYRIPNKTSPYPDVLPTGSIKRSTSVKDGDKMANIKKESCL